MKTPVREMSNLTQDLIEVFAELMYGKLLCRAAAEWQRAAENSNMLANAPYAKKLVRIAEAALVRASSSKVVRRPIPSPLYFDLGATGSHEDWK